MRVPRRKVRGEGSVGKTPVGPPLPTFAPKTPQLATVGHSATVLKGVGSPPAGRVAKMVGGNPGDRIVEWKEGIGNSFRCGIWNADGGTKCPYGVLVKITDFYRLP